MSFALTEDQLAIRAAGEGICTGFDDEYWTLKDKVGGFPDDFYGALAREGWLGIVMSREYGGAGLGISEAALLMETICSSGAGLSESLRCAHERVLPVPGGCAWGRRAEGALDDPNCQRRERCLFGVIEPSTGPNTLKLPTTAGWSPCGQMPKIWTSTAQVAHKIMLLAASRPLDEVASRPRAWFGLIGKLLADPTSAWGSATALTFGYLFGAALHT